jgi:prolyl oligopeptidase
MEVQTMIIDGRPTIAAPDDDPYLWLEEVEGERALAFVAQQNQATLEKFGGARFAADRDTLTDIFDRPDNIPFVTRRGRFLYNLWKDANNPRGLWRRTTLDEFRSPDPTWETILDVDKLAADESEDWIVSWVQTLPGNQARAILSLSRGGSDAAVLREFDIDTKSFVKDGFLLPEAKGSAAWLDADTLLLSSAFGEGMATTSGYAKTIRLWRRGTDVGQAPLLFETTPENMGVFLDVDRTADTPRIWFVERLGFFDANLWLGDATGPTTKLDLPTDVWAETHRDWLAVKLRAGWTAGGRTFAPDTVLGISLSAFLAGDRNFAIVFEPAPRRALQGLFWSAGRLVLSILDELNPVFEVLAPSGAGWARTSLPGLLKVGVVNVWRLDTHESESNGDLLASSQGPLTPPSLSLLEAFATPALLKRAPSTFSADGLVITQHEAISIDGERIPYVQTGPDTETGDAPVHLNAYGGFGLSVQPYYNSAIGKLWLERGGTSVLASIRGGGEFGTRWHDAGRYAGKRLAHDDFAAVAAISSGAA